MKNTIVGARECKFSIPAMARLSVVVAVVVVVVVVVVDFFAPHYRATGVRHNCPATLTPDPPICKIQQIIEN